jgi:hypothetical protein
VAEAAPSVNGRGATRGINQMPINVSAMDSKNQSNLKAVKSGAKIKYLYGMEPVGNKLVPVVLIGAGHQAEAVTAVSGGKHFSGEIEVLREPIKGKGELKVTGCGANRSEFDGAIARISKKKVFYA